MSTLPLINIPPYDEIERIILQCVYSMVPITNDVDDCKRLFFNVIKLITRSRKKSKIINSNTIARSSSDLANRLQIYLHEKTNTRYLIEGIQQKESFVENAHIILDNIEVNENQYINPFDIYRFCANVINDLIRINRFDIIKLILKESTYYNMATLYLIFSVIEVRNYIIGFDLIYSELFMDAIDITLRLGRCDYLNILLDIPNVLGNIKHYTYKTLNLKDMCIVQIILSKVPEVFAQYKKFRINCQDSNMVNHLMIYGFADKININIINNIDELDTFLKLFPIQDFCKETGIFLPSKVVPFLKAQNTSLSDTIVQKLVSLSLHLHNNTVIRNLHRELPFFIWLIEMIENTILSPHEKNNLINSLVSNLPPPHNT